SAQGHPLAARALPGREPLGGSSGQQRVLARAGVGLAGEVAQAQASAQGRAGYEYARSRPRSLFSARLNAVAAATMWHTQPSKPPEPIQKPGVMISQKSPRQMSPL